MAPTLQVGRYLDQLLMYLLPGHVKYLPNRNYILTGYEEERI